MTVKLIEETKQDYEDHRSTHTGAHTLSTFISKGPAIYIRQMDGLYGSSNSKAFAFGRHAHTYILEGSKVLDQEIEIFHEPAPINEKTGKPYTASSAPYKAWASRKPACSISQAEYDDLLDSLWPLEQSVMGHDIARGLLTDGSPEVSFRGMLCGVPVQSRVDWLTPNAKIVDLKTCADIDDFEQNAKDFGYRFQMAFYGHMVRTAFGQDEMDDAFLIAVEKKEPHRCGVFRYTGDVLCAVYYTEVEPALDKLSKCIHNNAWPTGYENLITL